MTQRTVISSDGLKLSVVDAGVPTGRPLVFIHGIAQSKAVWSTVFCGPLAQRYRLVAFDLRGHGDSDQPQAGALSRTVLADDLAAVIEGLDRPIIVAWSFGGTVLGEYLRKYGERALGGTVCVAAAIRSGRAAKDLFGPVMMQHARALMSEDLEIYEAAARVFFADSAAFALEPSIIEAGVREMLKVPPHVRRAFLSGGDDYLGEFSAVTVPLATIHCTADQVVLPAMSDLLTAATAIRLEGLGHVPWLEAPEAFVRALQTVL